jgi:lipoyl(octanoyl) transferase
MTLLIRQLGLQEYLPSYEAMKSFTESRTSDTPDEIWVLQHPPTYTLGQAGDSAHLLNPNTAIPLVSVNRGGQITYHGPGQVVVYLLLDLKRRHLFVRELVHRIEQAIIDTLADSGIAGIRKSGAPGIYLSDSPHVSEHLIGAKIAALGLKVTKQCCYHGLALNVDMDLKPFEAINPCGYEGLKTVDMKSLGVSDNIDIVAKNLLSHLSQQLEVRS